MRNIDEKFVGELIDQYCDLESTSLLDIDTVLNGLGFAGMLREMEFSTNERAEINRVLSKEYGLGAYEKVRHGTK